MDRKHIVRIPGSKNSPANQELQQLLASRAYKNIVIPDTNVIVQDPDSVREFLKGGNLLVIPWQVFLELDNLKKSSEVGWEAGKGIKNIHDLKMAQANLVIERRTYFPSGNDLNKFEPDHRIIATALYVVRNLTVPGSQYRGYSKVKLVTNDYGMQIVASEFIKRDDFCFEPYKRDLIKLKEESLIMPVKKILQEEIKKNENRQEYCEIGQREKIPYGRPVMIHLKLGETSSPYAVALRRDNRLEFLDSNLKLSGIGAKNNGQPNWQQIAALHLLLDQSVSAVFLQGGAGTGKTLLALAAGIHQRDQKLFDHLIIMRPTIYLSEDDNLGFLPGDINNKLAPWILSIRHNLAEIKRTPKNAKIDEDDQNSLDFLVKYGIEIQPLGYIRGASFKRCFIIIEEAQNLPRHLIKTILTRPAEGTKIVFTGDLGQIDNKRLTRESSGLAYAINKMSDNQMIGIVNFEQTLRSPLASLADKIL